MIQVRFKGYDLRLDPATPERIQAKDSEFGWDCQAVVGFFPEGSVVDLQNWMAVLPSYK
jgi:hypothetical protein